VRDIDLVALKQHLIDILISMSSELRFLSLGIDLLLDLIHLVLFQITTTLFLFLDIVMHVLSELFNLVVGLNCLGP